MHLGIHMSMHNFAFDCIHDGSTVTYTCSRISSAGELKSLTKIGTAPLSITTPVCSDVPEAMFVSAQAASN